MKDIGEGCLLEKANVVEIIRVKVDILYLVRTSFRAPIREPNFTFPCQFVSLHFQMVFVTFAILFLGIALALGSNRAGRVSVDCGEYTTDCRAAGPICGS